MNIKIEIPTKMFLSWAIQERALVEVIRLPYKDRRYVYGNLCIAEPLYECFSTDGRKVPDIQFRLEDVKAIHLIHSVPKGGFIWSIVLKELLSEVTIAYNLERVRKMLDQLVELKWRVEVGREGSGIQEKERGILTAGRPPGSPFPQFSGSYWVGDSTFRTVDVVLCTVDCLGQIARIQLK